MSDERILELVSADVDGELDAGQRRELELLLPSSAAAQCFRDDLRRIDNLLAELPVQEPPASLHARIIAAIPLPAEKRQRRTAAWLRFVTAVPIMGYGLSAAAGLLLAILVYESRLPVGTSVDPDELVGTMVPDHPLNGSILDSERFHNEHFDGIVQLVRHDGPPDGLLILDVEIDARQPVDMVVDLAPAGLTLSAVLQREESLEYLEFVDRVLTVRAVGRRKISVLFRRSESSALASEANIPLEFSSNGELLRQGVLKPAR